MILSAIWEQIERVHRIERGRASEILHDFNPFPNESTPLHVLYPLLTIDVRKVTASPPPPTRLHG